MQTRLTSVAMPMLQDTDLKLPEVELLSPWPLNSEFYGASAVAARYCGFKDPPKNPPGSWIHAWGPKQFLELGTPELYFGLCDLHGKNDYHWVGRLDEEDLLRRHGYKHAKAIGLPIVYVPQKDIVRRPGSLLVMPAHTGDDSTSEWNFEQYADEIAGIRSCFSDVWICIHPSCWEHGYWRDAFKKRGFRVVQGAYYRDRNALHRLYRLFSTFEYITTNAIGSHVAYAASLGAKVSIYGSYADLGDESYNNIPEYKPYIQQWQWARAEATVRQYYPELFCHPMEAKQRIDWGRYEVGFDNKVTPAELRSLFGWTLQARLTEGLARRISNRARACFDLVVPYRLGQQLRHRARMKRDADYRRSYEMSREVERLERMSSYTDTSTNLLGKNFELVDAKSFLAQYKAIFQQQVYRFETSKEAPLIIDGGANVGLSVLYFKRSFPKARIIAFEPDPDLFQVLSKNCVNFKLENVELIPKALWTREGIVTFDREGADAGRVVSDTNSLQAVDVAACRLRDYLDQEIDLLKLDLEGAEPEVLVDCADALGTVQKIVVEYHSFKEQPQKLHLITQILHDAGFRLHVNTSLAASQPLWWRQELKGMDMRLYVYGFRPRSASAES